VLELEKKIGIRGANKFGTRAKVFSQERLGKRKSVGTKGMTGGAQEVGPAKSIKYFMKKGKE